MMLWTLVTALAAPVCSTAQPTGPVQTALLPGRLGALRDPCIRKEVAITTGGSALVDTPDFYGRIQAVAALDLRWALHERVEVFVRPELFRMDQVVAPIAVTASGIGATAVGTAVQLESSDSHAITAHGQVVLPTAPYVNAAPIAMDLGLSGLYATRRGTLHGGATLLGRTMLGSGPADERAALTGRFGASRHLGPVSLVLDVPLSVGWTGGLDHLGVAGALRLGGREKPGGVGAELGVFAPVLGNDRTLAALELRVGGRWP